MFPISKTKNIAFEIKMLDNMLKRKIITDAKAAKIPLNLSPVQIKICHYLLVHQNEMVYQKDIEKLIESRRSTTSGILNTMEKNNLIKRVSSSKDARTKQILLTDDSKKLSSLMIAQKENLEQQLRESITEQELEVFFQVTEKIKKNIMSKDESIKDE